MIIKSISFLIFNFSALAVGSLFTSDGAVSDWYLDLNKAPWTPPGWVFGAAWTTVMICFAIYMAYLWQSHSNRRRLMGLYTVQLILNITWNPTFFRFHNVLLGLVIISSLTVLVGAFLVKYKSELRIKSLLILPYFIWLLIATSLNGYILFMN